MFDIGWSEMAVILLVALIVIGPKDLPRVARTMGQWAAKGRAMAREFQTALEDMAREAELDKVKNEIEKAGRTDIGKTIEKTIDPTGELSRAFNPAAGNAKSASAEKLNGEAAASPAKPAATEPSLIPSTGASIPAPSAPATPPPVERVAAKPARAKPPAAERVAAKPPRAKPARARSAPATSAVDGDRPKAPPAPKRKEPPRATVPTEPS